MFKSIRSQLLVTYIALSVVPLLLIGGLLVSRSFTEQRAQTLALQQSLSQQVAEKVEDFVNSITGEVGLLIKTQDLMGMETADEQEAALLQLLAYNDSLQSLALLDRSATELVRVTLDGAVDPTELQEWVRADPIYAQPLLTAEPFYSEVRFDSENGKPIATISSPLIDPETGFGLGVLVATVDFTDAWDFLAGVPVEEGESLYVVDVRDRVVAHRDEELVLEGTTFVPPEFDGRSTGLFDEDVYITTADVDLSYRAFTVVVERLVSVALREAFATAALMVSIVAVTLAVAVAVSFYVVNRITEPITALEETAVKIQDGDFAAKAPLDGPKEIVTLAVAMNEMTSHIQEQVDGLEQSVVARTQALESSIEVSRKLSTLLEQDALVAEVVEQIQQTFGYYHTHIYLMNATGDMLVMAGGTGEAGRVMLAQGRSIAVGTGMVGRVAETNTPIAAVDVTKDENWFHNPLLPETKSEAAVPISVGDTVLGVLDVQQDEVNSIRDEDIRVLQSIANQVAIALRNARLYAETQEVADQQLRINEINQKIQQATTVENALQIAVREIGRAVGSGQATVQLADFGVTQWEGADVLDGDGHISLEDAE